MQVQYITKLSELSHERDVASVFLLGNDFQYPIFNQIKMWQTMHVASKFEIIVDENFKKIFSIGW